VRSVRHSVTDGRRIVHVRVESGEDLRRVSRGLRLLANGKELQRRFVKDVRAEVRPLVAEVKAAYRAAPSQNQPNPRGRGDLRPILARATTLSVRTAGRNAGVTLRVDGRRMGPQMGGVPAMYEGRRPWRHPVFGQRQAWVRQDARPTFERIVPARAPAIGRRVQRLADDLAREVAKGPRL
jgi:hypothetical protein